MTRLKVYGTEPDNLAQRELSMFNDQLYVKSKNNSIEKRDLNIPNEVLLGNLVSVAEIQEKLDFEDAIVYFGNGLGRFDEFVQTFKVGDNLVQRFEGWTESNSPFAIKDPSTLRKDGSVKMIQGYTPPTENSPLSKKNLDDFLSSASEISNPLLNGERSSSEGELYTISDETIFIQIPTEPVDGYIWNNNGVIEE